MIVKYPHGLEIASYDLTKPICISTALRHGSENPNAFGLNSPSITPVKYGESELSTDRGASLNCFRLEIYPHGNGTHTESVRHIQSAGPAIGELCWKPFCLAELVSVDTHSLGNRRYIDCDDVGELLSGTEALIIRTLPNENDKEIRQYSGHSPLWLSPRLVEKIVLHGIQHLVLDLPSVDPEVDGGAMLSHKMFWHCGLVHREEATITELAFIPNEVVDGLYLLSIQVMRIDSDASPSRLFLFPQVL